MLPIPPPEVITPGPAVRMDSPPHQTYQKFAGAQATDGASVADALWNRSMHTPQTKQMSGGTGNGYIS